MADDFASHFGINNIPYGIATSKSRPTPQAATRIGNDVLFLSELTNKEPFSGLPQSLSLVFREPTLNSFAALSKEIHAGVRSAIQQAYISNLHQDCAEELKDVTLHLPVHIGDFTDFSVSENHNQNAIEALLGTRSLPPAFYRYPIAYAGRSSSIRVSGTPVTRPHGQFVEDFYATEKRVIFGPSRGLDYELEVGAIIGRPIEPGTKLNAQDADDHIFGLVLVNDWSARDIQFLEMQPLGPLNSKNFQTSISPWIITLEALKPFEVPAPPRVQEVAAFLDDPNSVNYALDLEVEVIRDGKPTVTCKVGFETMYWTFRQMLAHHTIGGCGLLTGDLISSGTVSGTEEHQHGCLLEQSKNGRKTVPLSGGAELRYLEDGDIVRFRGILGSTEAGVGFGECIGAVKPA